MGVELVPVCNTPVEVSSEEKSYLEDLLTCPVCLDICRPPIFQCKQGHSMCHVCHPKVKRICALCRGKVPKDLRNRALETLYNNTTFNCGNKNVGCMELIRGDLFEGHMQSCKFKQFKCRFANYKLQCIKDKESKPRSIPGIMEHLLSDHNLSFYPSGQYSSHEEVLDLREGVDIPLAFWKFEDGMFLEQITIRKDFVYLAIVGIVLGINAKEKLKTKNLSVEMQLIRKGFDCAPNIRKAIHWLTICPFGKNTEGYAVIYPEQDFKTTIAKCDPHLTPTTAPRKFCWISRLDFKWIEKK